MYKAWSHTGKDLESFPGVELEILSGTSVNVTISYWRSGHCFYAFKLVFENVLVNLQVYDEGNYVFKPQNWPSSTEFCKKDQLRSPVWVDIKSDRLSLYQDEAEDLVFYESIDSYLISGQNIVLLLDVESCKPRIQIINPNSLNER